MIDSHAHLYFDRFDDDRDDVIRRAREAGVEGVINIGIDVPTSRAAIDLARRHDGFWATVGLHPTSDIADLDADLAAIESLVESAPREVVAIGEIGLDYYWDNVSPEEQRPRVERQLDLATRLELPIVIHCRDALDDLLELLESRDPAARPPGVFHCFGGTAEHAQRALDLGYAISFAGNVTFPKARDLQEAARIVPLDRLLLETDCPFLAPQPRRGKRNEPAFATLTRDYLAELKHVPSAELDAATRRTTIELFRLPITE